MAQSNKQRVEREDKGPAGNTKVREAKDKK